MSEIVQLYYGHSGDSLSGAQGHPDDLIKWRADQPHETQSAVERMFSDAKRVLTRDRTLLHSSTNRPAGDCDPTAEAPKRFLDWQGGFQGGVGRGGGDGGEWLKT